MYEQTYGWVSRTLCRKDFARGRFVGLRQLEGGVSCTGKASYLPTLADMAAPHLMRWKALGIDDGFSLSG